MAVTKTIEVDENAIVERLVEKIAEYWDGRTINAPRKPGTPDQEWSDGDEEGNRVPGTYDIIQSIVGTINATASGTDLIIEIEYNVTIKTK